MPSATPDPTARDPDAAADAFLREADQFRLGALPTETPHPATANLSTVAREDLPAAVALLQQVDLDALDRLRERAPGIAALRAAVRETLEADGRVFLCGCGATGRLSLSLEVLWRELHPADAERVVSFMAGGDLALVHSVEKFEDHPEYGARQLEELGFGAEDLLVASTEGGETPWVIGAAERAAALSRRAPWFLYGNPDDVLCATVERSRRVIENPAIRKLNLYVGPMALAGSTRMQASTVLMLAAGTALLGGDDVTADLDAFRDAVRAADFSFLVDFVAAESAAYQRGGRVLYQTDVYGITLLTDTTERAPTFSLRPFENRNDTDAVPSLCGFQLPGTRDAEEAWLRLLHRAPRPLDWPKMAAVAGRYRLLGFDFSDPGPTRYTATLSVQEVGTPANSVRWKWQEKKIKMGTPTNFPPSRWPERRGKPSQSEKVGTPFHSDAPPPPATFSAELGAAHLPLLHRHLLLKLALNLHSTLVMGRLGRYQGNLMTWVRPSNKKLIDRAIRYVQHLLAADGVEGYTYADVARRTFHEMAELGDDEPVVLRVFESLKP